MSTRHLLSSSEAAVRLGIKRATLYAYVSRGVLTAHRLPDRRGSWFHPLELDRLTRTARHPTDLRPDLKITSAITLIEDGAYWYRGHAPAALARRLRFEQVAELLWTGELVGSRPAWLVDARAAAHARRAVDALPASASVVDRLRVIVAVLGARDALRFDLRPAGAVATARRLVAGATAALGRRHHGTVADLAAAALTTRRLGPKAVRAIDTALVVMADHELPASTLAVRVAASFRADPYAAASAGLGAIAGAWHGAASRRIEAAFETIARGQEPAEAIGPLLQEPAVPGFGHPLYPNGDPRVPILMALARSCGTVREADAALAVARAQGMPAPNVDFALAALARALRLPTGAGEALFAVGRLAGWLAHALEEYASPTSFRQRAVYVGVRPRPK